MTALFGSFYQHESMLLEPALQVSFGQLQGGPEWRAELGEFGNLKISQSACTLDHRCLDWLTRFISFISPKYIHFSGCKIKAKV